MDINTAFNIIAMIRQEFENDILEYPCMEEHKDLKERQKESNIQALTVALKELSKSLTEDFKSEMLERSSVQDIF